MQSTHRNAIGNLLVVITCYLGRIDHIFSNQLNGSVADSRWTVQKMTFDSATNICLDKRINQTLATPLKKRQTVERMVASLVTICPRARRALVRMKMAGASRAISIMPKIGLNELRRLWMVPSSSDNPSTRRTSSWDLEMMESEICGQQSL